MYKSDLRSGPWTKKSRVWSVNSVPVLLQMVSLSLQKEPLKGTIELADGLLFIDTLVALEALNEGFTGGRDRLSECRFPAPRRPFDDNRLLHPGGEIDDLELTGSITYLAAFSRAPN